MHFLQDLALQEKKKVVLDKKYSGGKSFIIRCSSTSCSFEVRVLKSKKKTVKGFFISSCKLEHHSCTGHARPTARQAAGFAVARAAVIANPRVAARSLVDQVQGAQELTVGRRMMYRVQETIIEDVRGDYDTPFAQLESLLETFVMENPGSHHALERDTEGRFQRGFLSHPHVATHVRDGQTVLGVDGSFMKHGLYREVMLILVGRTGNNTNIVLAVALCGAEDEDNCRWFLAQAAQAGVRFENVPVFSDRGRGLIAALEKSQPSAILRFCTRHIVGNVLSQFRGCVPLDLKAMVYRIQEAKTQEEYKSLLVSLGLTHPKIAAYLEAISAERWTMHPETVRNVKSWIGIREQE